MGFVSADEADLLLLLLLFSINSVYMNEFAFKISILLKNFNNIPRITTKSAQTPKDVSILDTTKLQLYEIPKPYPSNREQIPKIYIK